MILCLSILKSFPLLASDQKIIPLKKPILTDQELNKKILSNILVPLPKPEINKENLKAKKVVEKKDTKINFLIPKKKPQIAGIATETKAIKSKYYSKKDFGIAKRAISEMKKNNWPDALKISKKAQKKGYIY